jgi:hypothetical protein
VIASEVTQQLSRRREAEGYEVISGWLRVAFAVGQRVASGHVAFCPPFAHLPDCEVELAEGPAASARVAQVFPHGARIEVKLDTGAVEPLSVVVEFAAIEPLEG